MLFLLKSQNTEHKHAQTRQTGEIIDLTPNLYVNTQQLVNFDTNSLNTLFALPFCAV